MPLILAVSSYPLCEHHHRLIAGFITVHGLIIHLHCQGKILYAEDKVTKEERSVLIDSKWMERGIVSRLRPEPQLLIHKISSTHEDVIHCDINRICCVSWEEGLLHVVLVSLYGAVDKQVETGSTGIVF